jgi:glyoxylase-like metal-dependent hydrolase (beta-lactamase superfamily II)
VTPEEALERARGAGIHRLRIPTPFAVGRVNCYLIEDSPLTLIDTGPNSGKSLDELSQQLGDAGHAIEDLELIVISHQHIDHLGLVEILASHSGAEVAAIDVVVPFVERYGSDTARDDDFAAGLMRRYGIPEDMVAALRSVSASFRGWGAAAKVTRPLADGELIEFAGRRLEVQHRPGHSPSDTVFWDAERRILICADHLIAHISSNPLMARPLDGSKQRPKALVTYLRSLAKTRELPAAMLLPGHGEPITDHAALIAERFELHRRRAAKLEALIAERPRTAYELAQELWGNVAVTQAFLTLSEVVGHVDLLIDAGAVREVADGDVVRFEGTGVAADLESTIPS